MSALFEDKETQCVESPPEERSESELQDEASHDDEFKAVRRKELKLIQEADVGSIDLVGRKIRQIFAKYPRFIIYQAEGDPEDVPLTLFYADENANNQRIMSENCGHVQQELFKLYSTIHKARNPNRILRMVAPHIADVLDAQPNQRNSVENAKAIFENIVGQINKEYSELINGRIFYIIGCFSIVALLGLLSIVCFTFRNTDLISNNVLLVKILYAASFASQGGFVSMSIALNKLILETELKKIDYVVYGFIRMVVSILGGIFVFVVIYGGLVFNFNIHSSLFSVLAFCFAAGFSEKLVPDLLRKVEVREDEKNK